MVWIKNVIYMEGQDRPLFEYQYFNYDKANKKFETRTTYCKSVEEFLEFYNKVKSI